MSKSVGSVSTLLRRPFLLGTGAAKALYQSHSHGERLSLTSGGDSGARTRSLRLAKPALSQLSYIPGNQGSRRLRRTRNVVGLGGLEPPTSRLSGVRSNQLSYRPTSPAKSPGRAHGVGNSSPSIERHRFEAGGSAGRKNEPGQCRQGSVPARSSRSKRTAHEILNAREARPRIWPTGRIR